MIGSRGEDLLKSEGCFGRAAGGEKDAAESVAGFVVLRMAGEMAFERESGVGVATELDLNLGEFEPGWGEIRREADGFAKFADGFLRMARGEERAGELMACC